MQVKNPGASRLFEEGRVVKSVAESVNNSIVLQNDDELFFPMAANSIYQVDFFLRCTTPTVAPDGRWAVVGPAGAIGTHVAAMVTPAGAPVVAVAALGGAGQPFQIDALSGYIMGFFRMLVITTNAGNLQLQWAQAVAAIENTQVMEGSFLHWRRIV